MKPIIGIALKYVFLAAVVGVLTRQLSIVFLNWVAERFHITPSDHLFVVAASTILVMVAVSIVLGAGTRFCYSYYRLTEDWKLLNQERLKQEFCIAATSSPMHGNLGDLHTYPARDQLALIDAYLNLKKVEPK